MKKHIFILIIATLTNIVNAQEKRDNEQIWKDLNVSEKQVKQLEEAFNYKESVGEPVIIKIKETKEKLNKLKEEKKLLGIEIKDLRAQDPESSILQDKKTKMNEIKYDEEAYTKEIEQLKAKSLTVNTEYKKKLETILNAEQYREFEKIEKVLRMQRRKEIHSKTEEKEIALSVNKLKKKLDLNDQQAEKVKEAMVVKNRKIDIATKAYQKELKLILTKEQLEKMNATKAEKKEK